MFLKNALGEEISTYCLLDSDYHTQEAISARYKEALRVGVRLHIWQRKEIENYLLVPSAIMRVMLAKVRKKSIDGLTEDVLRLRLDKIAESRKVQRLMYFRRRLFRRTSRKDRSSRMKSPESGLTRLGPLPKAACL